MMILESIDRGIGLIFRANFSKLTWRSILVSITLAIFSVFSYVLAVVCFIGLYQEYVPDKITTVPIHLQYGFALNPYGMASVSHTNIQALRYDITVTLRLPRSPANVERGNFMVALHLLDNDSAPPGSTTPYYVPSSPGTPPLMAPHPGNLLANKRVLFSAARPTMIPYKDPLVALASRILFLPWHALFPTAGELVTLTVPMAERLRLRRNVPVPKAVLVEVQAGQTLQVDAVQVTMAPYLGGIRWLMYSHRIAAFFIITSACWLAEMAVLSVLTLFILWRWSGTTSLDYEGLARQGDIDKGKGVDTFKDDDLSDTERTFPSTGRQPRLRFAATVKREDDVAEESDKLPPAGAVADDEDEDEDEDEDKEAGSFRDSGIGTSMSDTHSKEGTRRRRVSRRAS